jgi:predicted alpha/beta hydrolase family esterase
MSGSKKQVFYIHGGEAYSNYADFLDNLRTKEIRNLPWSEQLKKWTGTLVEDLGDEYEVFTPSMPNSGNAKYEEWKIWFERHFEFLRDGVVLLGWSQGGYFLVKYLIENELPFQPSALILVAAPFEPADFGGEDGGDFNFDTKQVGELAEKVEKIVIFHSKDDFVVPFEHAEKYAAALPNAEVVTFADKNHFLIEEFPELLEKIRAF